jgi:hypothetical protein
LKLATKSQGFKYDLGISGELKNNIFMIEEKAILAQIQQLPDKLKQEVLHYVEFLQLKHNTQNQKPERRKAGSAEGKFKLAPDFDEPLEDFKEYM